MSQTARIIAFPARRINGEAWEPWLDAAAIARHFGVSARTVRRWKLEKCPSQLVGGSRRFKLSAVEQWIKERSAQ